MLRFARLYMSGLITRYIFTFIKACLNKLLYPQKNIVDWLLEE